MVDDAIPSKDQNTSEFRVPVTGSASRSEVAL